MINANNSMRTHHKSYEQGRKENLEKRSALVPSHMKEELISRDTLIQEWIISDKQKAKSTNGPRREF